MNNPQRPPTTGRDLKKLGGYLAGAGTLSLLAQGAGAAIIHQDFDPDPVASDPDPTVQGDISTIDFDLFTGSATVTTGLPPLDPFDLRLGPQDDFTGGSNPKFVEAGSKVSFVTGVDMNEILGPATAWSKEGATEDLPGGADQLLGFRRTAGSDFFYGWLRYSTGSVMLDEAAIEDSPNNPIRAGSTVAIPTPTTLSLLVTGAAGLAAVRRRRRLSA